MLIYIWCFKLITVTWNILGLFVRGQNGSEGAVE